MASDARAGVHLCTLARGENYTYKVYIMPSIAILLKAYYLMYFACMYVYAMLTAQKRVSDLRNLSY